MPPRKPEKRPNIPLEKQRRELTINVLDRLLAEKRQKERMYPTFEEIRNAFEELSTVDVKLGAMIEGFNLTKFRAKEIKEITNRIRKIKSRIDEQLKLSREQGVLPARRLGAEQNIKQLKAELDNLFELVHRISELEGIDELKRDLEKISRALNEDL